MAQQGTRKEREKLRHRDEILAAAESLFAVKGFHGATVEEVAARAEFAVGTVYNLFSSKDELYRSLIQMRCEQLATEGNAIIDKAGDPLAEVHAYFDAKIDVFEKHLDFVKLYTRERLGDRFSDTALWRDIVAPIHTGFMQRMTDVFRRGIDEGVFRNDLQPTDMAIALDGLTDGFLYAWLEFPESISFREKRNVMIKLFLDGVRRR